MAYHDEILAGQFMIRLQIDTAIRGGGARLENTVLRTTDPPQLSDALVAVSFPPHVDCESLAVADFLSIVPHVHSVRRTGSTAINLAYLATGRLDGFWVRRIACWDVAAGVVDCCRGRSRCGPCRHPEEFLRISGSGNRVVGSSSICCCSQSTGCHRASDLLTG